MEGGRDDLVGREPELSAIGGFVDDARPNPRALLIEGSAGIGKTTVWKAGVEQAADAGYRVLECRPARAEMHLVYGGLTDLLAGDVGDVLSHLPAPQRRAIEVALLLDDDDRPADQRALAAGVRSAFGALAAQQPLLLAIDDAQWLDPASALILGYALRRLAGVRIRVLASWRIESPEAPHPDARERQLDLDRALEERPLRVAVGPLSAGAIHQILRNRTGHSFPRPLLRRIHEASGGNPFFALEIARAMDSRRETWTSGEPLALSASLNDLLADRVTRLPRATQDALFLAAATTQPTIALLEAALGTAVRPALEPALEAHVIELADERIVFSHPLLAAAASGLPDREARRRWHLRLADASPDVESRARHLALARPGTDPAVALLLYEAARSARARGAPAEAGELYGAATERLASDQLERRAQWTVEAVPPLRQSGDLRRARSMLVAVVDELPTGALRSDALLALSTVVRDDLHGDEAERALIDRALTDAADDPLRRARALLSQEMWERHRDRFDLALPLAREALELATEAGDPSLRASALTRTADLEVLEGLADDPVPHFGRALEAGADLQLDSSGDSANAMLAACLIRAGRVEEARPLLLAEKERVRANGDEASLEMVCVFLTELEWLSGDWEAALGHAAQGLLVADQAESRLLQGALTALIALVEGSQGRIEAAQTRAVAAIDICEQVGDRSYAAYARQILGFLELSAGNPAAALEQFSMYPMPHGLEGTKRIAFVSDQIEAMAQLGHTDEAAHLAEELAARGSLLKRPTLSAASARAMVLVRGAQGDMVSAIASAERAVELTAGLGLPFERARSLLALGDAQRRAKHRAASRETLAEAIRLFDGLGAVAWSRRAADSLARVGGRVRHEGLTATEAQVAELVARGLTNKEVAAELFVTVRAVEANLSRIYAKLGIRSRTELAHRRW